MRNTAVSPQTIPPRSATAFTLIELLVVIGIIALLMGILLPVLGASREAAWSAICLGNLRSAGQAMAVYTTDNEDWLAGPNTSGWRLTLNEPGLSGDDVTAPTAPTQNMDWVSPTLGESLGLPRERAQRLVAIFNDEFRDPANDLKYSGRFGSGSGGSLDIDPTTVNYSSYSAALAFHQLPSGPPGSEIRNVKQAAVRLPEGYTPRLDRVGGPSEKVYAMDGARFVNGPNNVTFNEFFRQIRGGNFMDYGPATAEANLFRLTNDLEPRPGINLAYRHPSDRMNASHYDGHAATLSVRESVDVDLTWPSGSTVVGAFAVQDPEAENGDRVR